MAIKHNDGEEINLDDVELDVPAVPESSTEWNEGKPTGGEVGPDGILIPPPNPEDEDPGPESDLPEEPDFEDRTGDLVPEDEDSPGEDASEFYQGLSSILGEKGLMSLGEEGITTEEDFLKAYEKEIAARVDKRNKAVEEYMNAGVEYSVVSKIEGAIQSAESVTEEHIKENPELAQNLIISEFKQRGFDDETANRYYQMFKDSGKDTEEAMKALGMRKANLSSMLQAEVDKAKNAKKQAISAQEQLAVDLEKSIETGEMLGRKITASTQDKLKATLNTVVGYTPSGQPLNALMKYKMENPVDFEKNLLYLYTVTGGFSNLSSLDRSAETRISRKFKNSVTHLSSGKSFTEKSSTPNRTKIDIDSIDDIV